MDKIIKGLPFWNETINNNFTTLENDINNITQITNQNTTQLSDIANDVCA